MDHFSITSSLVNAGVVAGWEWCGRNLVSLYVAMLTARISGSSGVAIFERFFKKKCLWHGVHRYRQAVPMAIIRSLARDNDSQSGETLLYIMFRWLYCREEAIIRQWEIDQVIAHEHCVLEFAVAEYQNDWLIKWCKSHMVCNHPPGCWFEKNPFLGRIHIRKWLTHARARKTRPKK